MEKYINIVLICGVVINTIIIWLLANKDKSALPQKILIVFFICIIFLILNFFAEINRFILLYVLTFNVADFISLIIGPLLLVYIKSLFIDNKNLIKKNLKHFIFPAVYLLFFSIPILFFEIFNLKMFSYLSYVDNLNEIVFIYENIFLLIYLFITIQLFFNYAKATKSIYSNIDIKDLQWIKHLLYGVIIIISYDTLSFVFDYFYEEYDFESTAITVILLVVFLYFLGYKGINQSKMLVPDFLIYQNIKPKKTTSSLNFDTEEIQDYISKIKNSIVENELFLDEDLTLTKLGIQVNLSDKKLSAIINQKMNTSFYDLINSYRLDEFKKRIVLKEYDNITILGVAYDCGFKSKSTFNRLFKLHEKISPSTYKKLNS